MTVVDPDWPHGRSMFTEPPRPPRDMQRVLKRIEDVIETVNLPTRSCYPILAEQVYDQLPIALEACGDEIPSFDELVRRTFIRVKLAQCEREDAVDRGDVEFVV